MEEADATHTPRGNYEDWDPGDLGRRNEDDILDLTILQTEHFEGRDLGRYSHASEGDDSLWQVRVSACSHGTIPHVCIRSFVLIPQSHARADHIH